MNGASSVSGAEASASPPGHSDKKRRLNTTRTSQACTRCRSLKMKCIGATDPPCRRCRRTGATCDFVPRANAARPWSPGPYPNHTCTELWRSEVNNRLKALESANARLEALLAGRAPPMADTNEPIPAYENGGGGLDLHLDEAGPEFSGVLSALDRLRRELHVPGDDAWSTPIVCRLWESFRDHMPGLHFFSGQVSFVHPTPLLAVSILYVAAAHYPSPGMGRYQPAYFSAFTRAVGMLSVPDCPIRGTCTESAAGAVSAKFDDVLGIILVGLMAVGRVNTVGMWVNTAYRLLLDGIAEERARRLSEWRSLWEGLRTIDLEHSSLHLMTPSLPRSPPDPPFSAQESKEETDAGGPIGELLAIMQRCMPRFVGRGLPTMWETVCVGPPKPIQVNTEPEDMVAIRTWASEIDAWYRQTATETISASLYVRSITLLNYHLHKLFVLSIFFPLRGISYASASERSELLQSSRVVLKIESSGFEVWSAWDLVMVTNASLVLLHAYSQGAGEQEDIDLVQNHLNMLNGTHQTAPSLRHTLSTRLETALQAMRTPVRTHRPLPTGESVDQIVDTWQFQAASSAPASVEGEQPSSAPRSAPSLLNKSEFLFMDQAPDLGILPNLPQLELDSGEWPPFLLNLFGYEGGSGGPPPGPPGPPPGHQGPPPGHTSGQFAGNSAPGPAAYQGGNNPYHGQHQRPHPGPHQPPPTGYSGSDPAHPGSGGPSYPGPASSSSGRGPTFQGRPYQGPPPSGSGSGSAAYQHQHQM